MKTNCRVCNIALKESHQLKRLGGVALGIRLSQLHAELLTQGLRQARNTTGGREQ